MKNDRFTRTQRRDSMSSERVWRANSLGMRGFDPYFWVLRSCNLYAEKHGITLSTLFTLSREVITESSPAPLEAR